MAPESSAREARRRRATTERRTLHILLTLNEVPQTLGDLLLLFTAPHGSSIPGAMRHVARCRDAIGRSIDIVVSEKRFRNLLTELKRDGIINVGGRGASALVSVTRRGKELLGLLHKKELPHPTYVVREGTGLTIVCFDIPETKRTQRAWFRQVLRHLQFTMLQKSVWMGNAKIPLQLLADLKRFGLLNYIQIVSVTKSGTLRHVRNEG